MTKKVAGVEFPDSTLAREATEMVRGAADDLLFGHSRRSYCDPGFTRVDLVDLMVNNPLPQ